ncbi:hypothetical protein HD554DRAFT_2042324 [Boletus coccyginus]|nr:hypothetical protein HD554DRAFT_2042324 [Boletus coccyginus]
MPVVPNSIYKIISVKYSPPNVDKPDEQVADLIDGGPGPIAGRPDAVVHNDRWIIWNKYDLPDSNSVTIQNVKAPKTYAYGAPALGNPIVGNNTSDAIIWTLVKRERPDGRVVFNIQYPDKPHDDLVWELKEKNQNVSIPIFPHPHGYLSHWFFPDYIRQLPRWYATLQRVDLRTRLALLPENAQHKC